jgi:hypothetical protein
MIDFVGFVLRVVGFRKIPPVTEIVVSDDSDLPAIQIPAYRSSGDAAEALDITTKREEIAERSRRTVEHILGATVAASEIRRTRAKTAIELEEMDGKLNEAVALNELNEELRVDRHNMIRQQVRKQMREATAEATIADAHAQVAEFEAAKIIDDAKKKFAIPEAPDAKVVAEERSRAEQEAEDKEWALNVVLDVAAWTYPVTDEEGYLAYAACQYFAPRLDHGRSHDEAVELAVEQLLRRKQLRGRLPQQEANDMARRAKAMWTKWKAQITTEKAEAQRRKAGETVYDAAKIHLQAAELLHEAINGDETNEDFDATK